MSSPGSPPLEVGFEGVVKRYGPVTALHDIDLRIGAGQFVVLLGPSGSGKSTLIRSLAGVERIDAGRLTLNGQAVADARRHLPPERRNLAMVFQDYALWPHLTALGNVCYALRRLRIGTADARGRAHEVLERVGLAGHADRYPHELSGGEQQRVALARAVVARPGLLLFDEPLSNLDADLRERLRVEISTLTRETGATAVYITHDQSEAFALADQIGVLEAGRLVQFGPPEDIYHRPANRFVARFTGLAGEMPGVVTRVSGDEVGITVSGCEVRGRHHGRLHQGDPVRVAIRPAAVRIGQPAPSAPGLTATVVDVAYRGRGYDHVVRCGDHMLTGIFDDRRHPRGARVVLDLAPSGCVAYPEDTDVPQTRNSREVTAVRIPA
ncbi:MAG TPA: ABC transporter ATP-binding protein [Acidimicrobiales bacterium]|nr:ABC transporter ATP-binding protein [Acidimicrobiales bacterium]